jgi:hypothetical protein
MDQHRPTNWIAAGVIIAIWIIVAAFSLYFIVRVMRGWPT